MLYNWDAVQFALALREYDVAKHQPHPPGYLLYVALGRLVNAWLGDPTAAYVALAVLFSAGYHLRRLLPRARGSTTAPPRWRGASLLAVSPLFWFYGSVGLTYAGEALVASVVAYFAYARAQRQRAARSAGARSPSGWPAGCGSRCSSCSFRSGSAARSCGVRGAARASRSAGASSPRPCSPGSCR